MDNRLTIPRVLHEKPHALLIKARLLLVLLYKMMRGFKVTYIVIGQLLDNHLIPLVLHRKPQALLIKDCPLV